MDLPRPLVRSAWAGLLVAALGASAPAYAVPAVPQDEPALAVAWQGALWPADIALLAGEYLRLYGHSAQAAGIARIRDAAQRTADLLRTQDVRLYRTAFEAGHGAAASLLSSDDLEDRRRAALGDAEAAWRQSQLWPAGHARRLGWLHLAELLGNGRAAYELALHYRRDDRPLLAARHEAQAQALGYLQPYALDHARK